MFTHKNRGLLVFLLVSSGLSCRPGPEAPMLGKPAAKADVKAWSIGVFPDGKGLPPGRGNAAEGEAIYQRYCEACHGSEGVGYTAEELAGGENGLTHQYPDKTIGTYWPYASTIFDFTRRAMPLNAPGSLSDDAVYAVTAYLLYINGIIDQKTELSATTLPKISMPNRHGFIRIYSGERK